MKTPGFWSSRGTISSLLIPAAALYDIVSRLKRGATSAKRLSIPVICIGNVTVGGGGKTPLALLIGQKLKERNLRAYYLSRGYGGQALGPLLVDPAQHTAAETGDEPLLLARVLPTVIAKDRRAGAAFAIAQGAEVIIMDDGFQNPSLAKDFSILVIDGKSGFGNGRLMPAGPLREKPARAFARAQGVVVVGPERHGIDIPASIPVITAHIEPLLPAGNIKGKSYLAFCGLALPDKFFSMLRALHFTLEDTVAFADHHPYSDAELKALITRAKKSGATLITTAKDAVRIAPDLLSGIEIADIALMPEQPEQLDVWLDKALQKK